MMLNAASGSTVTGAGVLSSGASHACTAVPAAPPSMLTSLSPAGSACPASAEATGASRNRIVAALSASIVTSASGVEDGASGATATPARNAPRNTQTYSMLAVAQM